MMNLLPSVPVSSRTWGGSLLPAIGWIAFAALAGCRGPGAGMAATNVDTQANSSATADPPTTDDAPPPYPIEVVETKDYDGRVLTRAEGYYDENGDFIRHGTYTTYHDNGQKKLEEHYINGVVDGERTSWYDSGQISGHGYYDHGKEDGTWTAWWPNGFKQQEFHMVDGTWDGTHTTWHQNGEKRMELHYVNGLRQGPFIIWDDQGNEVYRGEYLDDVEQP